MSPTEAIRYARKILPERECHLEYVRTEDGYSKIRVFYDEGWVNPYTICFAGPGMQVTDEDEQSLIRAHAHGLVSFFRDEKARRQAS